jgi:hypothetical protein
MSGQEFFGIFGGFSATCFAVLCTMKCAQEIKVKNFQDAIDDLKRASWGSIVTFIFMLSAIINLNEVCDSIQRKSNSAARKKSAEIAELRAMTTAAQSGETLYANED